ncbi:response regulator [Rhodospirillaceae bacterium SYSU D60014]|uniref:response regulator n=1 Tax=Virgifigura deserti TaxID=2268457 RepID=UPI000E66CA82
MMARVLIIDDEQRVRSAVRQMLKSGGHEVTEASHGLMGMNMLKQMSVDVVITDIFMPVQDGLQTIRELRKSHPKTKILAISGSEWSETYDVLHLAGKLGAHRVLRKPFTVAELETALSQCLDPAAPRQQA